MGRVGRGLWGPVPRGELCWGRLWGSSRFFSVSSPESVIDDGQSIGESDGKPDAAGAAARSASALPTPPPRPVGLRLHPGRCLCPGRASSREGHSGLSPRGMGAAAASHFPPGSRKVRGVVTRGYRDELQVTRFHLFTHPPTLLEVKLRLPRDRVSWTFMGNGAHRCRAGQRITGTNLPYSSSLPYLSGVLRL